MSGRVYRLPAGIAFADTLAKGLLARTADNPLALAEMMVLLPTRRACRTLRQSFLRQSAGKPLLLPRLVPLGDLDADELLLTAGTALPPAISPRARQLLLASLIRQHTDERSMPQLLQLARALATLLDDFTLEGVTPDKLEQLVPDNLSSHWQTTLTFLQPLISSWRRELKAKGLLDPAERRTLLLNAQAEQWQREPPNHPVIAAGSTGSIPATAALLKVISQLPQGEVILPGLPEENDWWEAVDATHPLYELKQLLTRLELIPAQVSLWPDAGDLTAPRSALLHHALLPASLTERWATPQTFDTAGLTRIDCAHEQEEAAVIATIMRGQLESDGKTAMLVTPDRNLGRRVAQALQRWGIGVDDSAGTPLHKTESATFLRALLAYSAAPTLTSFLALMKHPMAAMSLSMPECRQRIRAIELAARRNIKEKPRTLERLIATEPEHAPWLQSIADLLEPLVALRSRSHVALDECLALFTSSAEALASTDSKPGTQRLWRGEAGMALAEWLAELLEQATTLAPIASFELEETLLGLMADVVVRPRYGEHPRLFILGPLEARLQQADLLILGGLNEGTWPAIPEPDPWLSRDMRRQLGLKTPEERLGQEAHDFYTLAAAPRVLLTRALRQGGTPTVPARWLSRLETIVNQVLNSEATDWLALARALEQPVRVSPVSPPAPCPPVEARPRELWVTEVEKLLEDPYAIYAKKVLKLHPLEPIEPDIGAAERGTFYHAVLQQFRRDYPQGIPDNLQAILHRIGAHELKRLGLEGQRTLWWPRFVEVCKWFEDEERKQLSRARPLAQEREGTISRLDGFKLKAKADRIDLMSDGTLAIIDYKTGTLPAKKKIARGLSVQLPLEAAIARAGGFKDIPAKDVSEMAWWHLTGKRDDAGEVKPFPQPPAEAADEALQQFDETMRWFTRREAAYLSEPDSAFRPVYSDYRLLARVKEWAANGEEDAYE